MFKEKVIKFLFNRLLKNETSIKKPIAWNKCTSFGMVYTLSGSDDLKILQSYIENLKKESKTVQILVFVSNEINTISSPCEELILISKKDFLFNGGIKNKAIINFIENKFDCLINPSYIENSFTDYIVAKSKATMRIGLFSENKINLYSLMVFNSDNLETIVNDSTFYHKKINSNE